MKMYVDHLKCIHCMRKIVTEDKILQCPYCGGALDVIYDYERVREVFSPELLSAGHRFWKYEALLPLKDATPRVTLGEGGTPLLRAEHLSEKIGLTNLYLKDETLNPTGSFKDRSMSVGISKALESEEGTVVTASSGNAATAVAAYAARSNMICYAFVPEQIPDEKIAQLLIYGGRVIRCTSTGHDDPCYTLMKLGINHFNWYPLPSSRIANPYPVEGLKTIAYEICEGLDFTIPEWVIIPMGAGTLLSGNMKGWSEFCTLGIVDAIPGLIGIQATGCAPLVKAFQENTDPDQISPWQNPHTIAGGLIDPYPWDAHFALSALRNTGGTAYAVADKRIRETQILLGKTEGIFAEASGAAGLAGLIDLYEDGLIDRSDSVVVEITGSGLKESSRFVKQMQTVPTITPEFSTLTSTLDSLCWAP